MGCNKWGNDCYKENLSAMSKHIAIARHIDNLLDEYAAEQVKRFDELRGALAEVWPPEPAQPDSPEREMACSLRAIMFEFGVSFGDAVTVIAMAERQREWMNGAK